MILSSIASGKNQHLLLVSLKEVIFSCSYQTADFPLDPYLPLMLPFLLTTSDSVEESVRKIVAECLGALVVSHSSTTVAPLIASLWQDSCRNTKYRSLWTAVTAYRCAVSSHQSAARSDIVDVLAIAPLIQSCEDLEVNISISI